ncbi:hypothetical protein SAMN05421636_101252 [Pricia antarctica]|uniref:Uncharacterized protein n=1 Tax=Pricia antarctica TaxID=641691 RepID=A0A1G6WAT6_9FLAO|nr:hypothetical protein SAMN05421636_101252 [Pricia antarctica]
MHFKSLTMVGQRLAIGSPLAPVQNGTGGKLQNLLCFFTNEHGMKFAYLYVFL